MTIAPATQEIAPSSADVTTGEVAAPQEAAAPSVNLVTSGNPYRVILKLALPTVGAMLLQNVVNIVDMYRFGKLSEADATAADAVFFPSLVILWIFGGSLSAISVGTQAFSGRRYAEQRYGDAGGVLLNALTVAGVLGLLFTGLAYLFKGPLLGALCPDPHAREAAEHFLGIRLLSIPSMAATFALKAFFDGVGKTGVHFVASAIMNTVNVALSWVLITGAEPLGIAPMGFVGAAVSGTVATYLGLVIMLGFMLAPAYRKRYHFFDFRKFSRRLTWDVVKLSIPGGLATVAVMSGFLVFAGIASKLDDGSTIGPINGAATTLVVTVMKLTFFACLAFGTSTATLVSQALGERDPDKAARFGWSSVKLGIVVFGVVGVVEALAARPLLGLFQNSDAVLDAATGPFRLMGIITPLIATGMILTQALFGAGATKYVMVAELLLHFTCLVPLAWLLGLRLDLGLMGVWSAAVAYIVGLALAMGIKFKLGGWKRIRL
ncbi:MAG: MATE family efflux transporter [Polyangiaceae bacterium]|nr:MATE family efflux transporter [Polyangiaceae bacterium]